MNAGQTHEKQKKTHRSADRPAQAGIFAPIPAWAGRSLTKPGWGGSLQTGFWIEINSHAFALA